MTQMELARKGKVSEALKAVAAAEIVDVQTVRRLVAEGRIAIPLNKNRQSGRILGIGQGLRVKVNANIGTSTDYADIGAELEKLKVAEEAGADAIMDLSTGGDLRAIRRRIMEAANVCVGSVPIYEAAAGAAR